MAAVAPSQGLFSPANREQVSAQCLTTPAITVIFAGERAEFTQVLHLHLLEGRVAFIVLCLIINTFLKRW